MENQSKLLRLVTHPSIAVTASIASVISVPLSIYLFIASLRSPELTYYVHPLRTNIVTREDGSPLQVRYAGQEVTGNVTAVQIALWNAGNEPITTDKILERATLKIPKARILDAAVRQLSRPVTSFRIDDTNKARGEISFEWRILEKNDGAVVQVIFEGPPHAEMLVAGAIVNQAAVEKRTPLRKISTPEEQRKGEVWAFFAALAAFTSMIVVVGRILLREGFRDSIMKWIVFLIVGCLGAIAYVGYSVFWKITPFGLG